MCFYKMVMHMPVLLCNMPYFELRCPKWFVEIATCYLSNTLSCDLQRSRFGLPAKTAVELVLFHNTSTLPHIQEGRQKFLLWFHWKCILVLLSRLSRSVTWDVWSQFNLLVCGGSFNWSGCCLGAKRVKNVACKNWPVKPFLCIWWTVHSHVVWFL